MDDASEVRPRNSANSTHRHPKLREADRLPWLKERIRLLIAEQSCLDLDVGAVVIRECFAPVESVGISAPRPYFFRRKLRVVGIMRGSGIRMRMPNTHERLAAGMHE